MNEVALPYGGIDVTLLCAAIGALEKVCGPKILLPDSSDRVFVLLAELQHVYKQLPDAPKEKKRRKAKA